jgi:ParB-like chromosome segregation protein Spo0J
MEHLPDQLIELTSALSGVLAGLSENQRIEALNYVRGALHKVSPFRDEPIDFVLWVKEDTVRANDYNPNVVAPPEYKLLRHSIETDGYTQPIVTYDVGEHREVVDGAHRRRVGVEDNVVRNRIHGYLPVTTIREDRTAREDRIAATMRHNLARGKHTVVGEREIVLELVRRNWTDKKIMKELGVDADKLLRLKQTSGLAAMFADREFSEAWEIV